MDADSLKIRRLVAAALERAGALPLALLLETLVAPPRLRELARRFGVAPKGFRVERAPAAVLAKALAELRDSAQVDEVVALLLPARTAPDGGDGDGAAPAGDAATADTEVAAAPSREQFEHLRAELERLGAELERAREGNRRAQERTAELQLGAQRDAEQVLRLLGELRRARSAVPAAPSDDTAAREREQKVHELEQEVAARDAADAALRRQLAVDRTRIRELEEEVAELQQLVPKGRRRKAPAAPPPEPPARRFLLPYFLPSFYRSLDGRDRRQVERALQAILLFCTEGHSYPGLEVKHLGGQDTWSLRVSLGLRAYFRARDDGDVEFLELADREDQHTTLRRLKDK